MGANNAKNETTRSRRSEQDFTELHQDLQNQQEQYEAKYMDFVQSQIKIYESIRGNLNRPSPNSRSPASPVPSTSSLISTPSVNTSSGNITYYDTRPYFSSSTSSTSPLSSVPLSSSNVVTPSNNTNTANISNTGAIPKSRNVPATRLNSSHVGVKCVTCNTDLELHIFQCRNGHSSCNFCRFSKKNCGRCSMQITDVRNITLETTIADIKTKHTTTTNNRIKCCNASIGCCLSFTIYEMDDHLKECPYMDIECPLKSIFQTCSWKGKINNIHTHFNNEHPDSCVADVDKEMTLRNIDKDQTLVYYINIGQFNFIIYIELSKNKRTLSMTAQLLGTKVSASKWTYEFILYDKYKPQRKFQYLDVCYSNTALIKNIFNNQQCATVNAEYAKTFINRGCLTYKFHLKRNAKNISKN